MRVAAAAPPVQRGAPAGPRAPHARAFIIAPSRQRRSMAAAAGTPQPQQGTPAVDKDEYDSRWHEIWDGGLEPGNLFDLGAPTPMLTHLLEAGDLSLAGKRLIVPGCGRGYDVAAAARAGAAAAVGLDLSPAAVRDAAAHHAGEAPDTLARMSFVTGDFFTYADPGGLFDFGWDYTFLCALHPSMRTDWAAGWGRLLAPGGELLTMVYPVDPSRDAGPPWPVTPELYKQLLLPAGFELLSLERIPDRLSHPKRVGREWLGRWRYTGAGAGDAAQE